MSELYFFNATADNGRVIMPDKQVPMEQFMTYLQNGKDPELSFVSDVLMSK